MKTSVRLTTLGLLALVVSRCDCGAAPLGAGDDEDGGSVGGPGDSADGGPGDGGPRGTEDGAVACISGLTSIALSPADAPVTLDGQSAPSIVYTATGEFSDGHTQVLDARVLAWSAARDDDTASGEVVAGEYHPNPSAGGVVRISVSDGCVTGQTTATFFLDAVVAPPEDLAPWAGAPVESGTRPTIVYPSDETRFPRNIYRTLFQWRTGGLTEFRLTFEGPSSKVVVFTDGAHGLCAGKNPAAGCWEADERTWSLIAASNAGRRVTWTVDGLDRSRTPAIVRRGAPIHIAFSRRDVAGAIFYWSTTSAGIRRANIRAATPEDYITGRPRTAYPAPNADSVQCVGCHVASRDGRFLAAPVKSASGDSLWVMEVEAIAPPSPLVKQVPDTRGHGFATIAPDNQRVVAAWRGKMWALDRATGAKIGDLPLGALRGTHPDWSPDGKQLAFATGQGDAPRSASIALISWNATAGTWGSPAVVVPAAGDRSNLFPMFSHDGGWLAFSRGKGGHGDPEAQLFLAETATTGRAGTPIELVRANRVVSNRLTDGLHQNSQPTWAPPGDFAWVAFNSKREYGVVLPEGTQQIWVAAVDLAQAGAGDPSFPAFRLQFQGLEENNHRAFWTLDLRDTPDGGVQADASAEAGGDGGTPDPGGSRDGGACVEAQAPCDPVADTCCGSAYVCDSQDDGVSYACILSL